VLALQRHFSLIPLQKALIGREEQRIRSYAMSNSYYSVHPNQTHNYNDLNEPAPQGSQSTQPDFNLEHRRLIRKLELEQAVPLFGLGRRVLEIGAGAGWQAGMLARKGYQVTAIDVPESNYTALREWNVILYDGVHIPAPDRYFDVIFSSNVLEHVTDLPALQQEMHRVLKPGGIAVHIMPTPAWRLWTTCSFYAKRLLQTCSGVKLTQSQPPGENCHALGSTTPLSTLRRALFPARHGIRGTWLPELYLFSEYRWRNTLANKDWQLLSVVPNGLFYSGYRIFGEKIPIATRRRLSSFLGSSCKLYVLKRSTVRSVDFSPIQHAQ
jgi:2-polyprenyl-3-methyl-5-hydroxy-6-metoxy-1,4-benzoquinol methylase